MYLHLHSRCLKALLKHHMALSHSIKLKFCTNASYEPTIVVIINLIQNLPKQPSPLSQPKLYQRFVRYPLRPNNVAVTKKFNYEYSSMHPKFGSVVEKFTSSHV